MSTFCHSGMKFLTLERKDTIGVVEDVSHNPKWVTVTGALSVRRDCPTIIKAEIDQVLGSLIANLESYGLFSAIHSNKCCQFHEKVGADVGKVIDFASTYLYATKPSSPISIET